MRLVGTALLTVLALGAPSAGQAAACRVTLAEYRALQPGDRLASVVHRLGCRGRKVGDVTYGKRRRVNYSWRGRGRFGANLTLTFANGRLVDKSELGLE